MKDLKLAGLRLPIYIVVFVVLLIAIFMGVLPKNMIGAFLFLVVVGELLNIIGNHCPIIKTYFGGGPIVVIFGGAALVYFKLLPKEVIQMVDSFMKDSIKITLEAGGKMKIATSGFLDFYIAALITGSILGMNRKLLIKAAIRYLPTIIAGVVVSLGLVALIGPLVGITTGQAVAYVGIPIMGGGMGAGAVPISQVFEKALGIPADEILSKLVPAVALGNAMAIVAGGLLNKLGKVKPSLTGNGQMMARGTFEIPDDSAYNPTVKDYTAGIIMATMFFSLGSIIAFLLKKVGVNIHPYAWMILSVALAKVLNIIPTEVERACSAWYKFVAGAWTAALMLGIGMSYTNLGQIIKAFTPQYVILCAVVVIGAIIGTGFMGRLLGFNFVEAAITAGLCMANMGGTGDVAVLTASNRMELMPFAQISSRLGGAFIIFLASVLVPIFFG